MPALERKRLDVSVEPDLYLRLKHCAALEGRSVSAQIRWFLENGVGAWQDDYDDTHCNCAAVEYERIHGRKP